MTATTDTHRVPNFDIADRLRLVSGLLPQGVTMHCLRHTFATTCYRATNDILAVSQLLGHASVATTMKYILLDPDRLRRVASTAA